MITHIKYKFQRIRILRIINAIFGIVDSLIVILTLGFFTTKLDSWMLFKMLKYEIELNRKKNDSIS